MKIRSLGGQDKMIKGIFVSIKKGLEVLTFNQRKLYTKGLLKRSKRNPLPLV